MKKLIVLLSICIFIVTGCNCDRLDTVNLGKNIKILLSKKSNDIYNTHYDGYKYYVPKGLKFVTKEEYNAVLLDKYNNKYFLFIDAIAYFHKKDVDYDMEKDIHYSKKLSYNGKNGYIRIEKIENKFFIQFVYNYAKMEALVSEDNLVDVVNNMCFVLRSIKFNDAILESLIGDNVLSYKEENFVLFDNDKSSHEVILGTDSNIHNKKKNDFYNEDFKIETENDYVFDN